MISKSAQRFLDKIMRTRWSKRQGAPIYSSPTVADFGRDMNIAVSNPDLTIRLCGPRGFCAGVDRAIQIVVLALKAYGAPVYVRHEIVHNRYVVAGLEAKGAVFVEELDEIPEEHRAQP